VAAFKYGWLVLRGPKAFLERFGAGALEIERAEVVDFAWTLRHELAGGSELTEEEIEIIDQHNAEASAYVQSSPRNNLMLVR
jgi:7-cyano-7-deazaguanine synthase in queuosine biosynthesis